MSSPSTPGSEMFPAANDQLPQVHNTSPPNSQEALMSDVMSSHAPNESADTIEGAKSREPGWAWSNKQAQEEYGRAYEVAVDKDFPERLQEFGDVLADEP